MRPDEKIVPDYLRSSSERIAKMAILIRAELNMHAGKKNETSINRIFFLSLLQWFINHPQLVYV